MEHFQKFKLVQRIRNICIFTLFFVTHNMICLSQGIKVVRVEEINTGSDAFHAPIGKDGMPCGLVKIKTTFTDLSFQGQIVGDVDNKTNEYFVYMERGATQLIVSRPNILPVVVQFPDFGIECITSKATYNVQIKEVKLNPQKNTVTIDIKPRFASIFIDDIPIDINDNGHYQIILPKGSHFCRFEAEGYSSYVQGINIGKDSPNLSVELESQLSDLDISCQTPLTSIYINDSLIGREAWRGKLPSGIYQVDIRKDGYVSYSQNITLQPKDSQSIVVPKLIRKKGKVMIETRPIKFRKAFIDGFEIRNFPVDIEAGKHSLTLQAYGCDEIKDNIEVVEDQDNPFTYLFSIKNQFYERAYQGNLEIVLALADNKIYYPKNQSDIEEGKYWLSKIMSKKGQLNASFLSRCFYERPDQYWDFKASVGELLYVASEKNCRALFLLFTSEHVKDYESALEIIELCGSMADDFDGVFCCQIGDACMEINRGNEAILWYKKCLESNTYSYVKERAQKVIIKIEKEKSNR